MCVLPEVLNPFRASVVSSVSDGSCEDEWIRYRSKARGKLRCCVYVSCSYCSLFFYCFLFVVIEMMFFFAPLSVDLVCGGELENIKKNWITIVSLPVEAILTVASVLCKIPGMLVSRQDRYTFFFVPCKSVYERHKWTWTLLCLLYLSITYISCRILQTNLCSSVQVCDSLVRIPMENV